VAGALRRRAADGSENNETTEGRTAHVTNPIAIPEPEVRIVELKDLRPWDKNPRRGHAVEAIARSIEQFGYLAPIIVQKRTMRILAGHGRYQALVSKGYSSAPVVMADVTDEQATQYTLADNKLGEISVWDEQLLKDIVLSLGLANTAIPGFDEAELEELLRGLQEEPAGDVDEVLEPIAEAVTQPGDLWQLGEHRLLCGDSTKEQSYKELMGEEKAALVFTDPPYGVDYKAKKFDLIANDELKGNELLSFLARAFGLATAWSTPRAAFYVWHASSTREEFGWALKAAALVERQYLIWVKPSITLGHADYHWQHEPCFYAAREGQAPEYFGDRTQGTVWQIGERQGGKMRYQLGQGVLVSTGDRELYVTPAAPRGKKLRRVRLVPGQAAELATEIAGGDCWFVGRDTATEHPTQKPVELARRAIENSTRPGAIVLDPFSGSGSTILAAEVTGRRGRGIELSPQYADVIVRRWQRLTGRKAECVNRPGTTVG
jgi:DNA modification methylase